MLNIVHVRSHRSRQLSRRESRAISRLQAINIELNHSKLELVDTFIEAEARTAISLGISQHCVRRCQAAWGRNRRHNSMTVIEKKLGAWRRNTERCRASATLLWSCLRHSVSLHLHAIRIPVIRRRYRSHRIGCILLERHEHV